jgi:hypothetical protein
MASDLDRISNMNLEGPSAAELIEEMKAASRLVVRLHSEAALEHLRKGCRPGTPPTP